MYVYIYIYMSIYIYTYIYININLQFINLFNPFLRHSAVVRKVHGAFSISSLPICLTAEFLQRPGKSSGGLKFQIPETPKHLELYTQPFGERVHIPPWERFQISKNLWERNIYFVFRRVSKHSITNQHSQTKAARWREKKLTGLRFTSNQSSPKFH